MTNKSKFLKNLLTTTAVALTVAGASSSAFGAGEKVAQGHNPAQFSVAGDWKGGLIVDGDHAKLAPGFEVVEADTAKTITMDLNDENGTLQVGKVAAGLAGVINSNVAGGKTLSIVFNDDTADFTLGLNGVAQATFTNQAALGRFELITSVDFADKNKVFIIATDGADLSNATFKAGAANTGTVTVNAIDVKLGEFAATGGGGGNKVKGLTLNAAKSATLTKNVVLEEDVSLGDNSVLTVNNGVNITARDIKGGGGAGQGTLKFVKTSTVNGTIGAGNALKDIQVGAGAVTVTDVTKSTNITFTDAASEFITNEAVEANLVTTADGKGKFTLLGGDKSLKGNIGKLEAVHLGTNHTLTWTSGNVGGVGATGDLYAPVTTAVNGQGKFELKRAAAVTLHEDIGDKDKSLALFQITDADGAGAATTVTLKEGKTIWATNTNVNNGATANILILEKDTAVKGTLDAGGANGEVHVNGAGVEITGNIGTGAALKAIKFLADGNLTTGGNITSPIDFDSKTATLKLGNADVTVTGAITKATNATIDATATGNYGLKIDGAIGTAAADALKLLDVTGRTKVELAKAGVYIDTLNLGGSNTEIDLQGAGKYLIKSITNAGSTSSIKVSNDLSLEEGTKISGVKTLLFNGDKTLTVNKDVAIDVAVIDTNTAGSGAFVFEGGGTNTVTGAIGLDNRKFKALTVNGNDTSVILGNHAFFNDDITIDDKAKLTLKGANYVAHSIVGGAGDKGILVFDNASAATVKTTGGAGNRLAEIQVNGSDVTIEGAGVDSKVVKFTNAEKASTLTLQNGFDIGAATVTTASTSRNHNIAIDKDTNFATPVGEDGKALGNVILTADKTATITTDKFFAGVTTTEADKGVVDLREATDKGVILNIGSAGNQLKTLTVTNSATVKGDAFVKNATVAAGKTLTLEAGISSTGKDSGLNLTDAASTVVLKDGATLLSDVTAVTNNSGVVTFEGSSIAKNIGTSKLNVAAVNFNGAKGKRVVLTGDIYSAAITAGEGTLEVGADGAKLSGATTATKTTIDIAAGRALEVEGTFDSKESLTLNLGIKDDKIGHISMGTSTVNLVKTTINVDAEVTDLSTLEGRKYAWIIKDTAGKLTQGEVQVGDIKSSNVYAHFKYDKDNNVILGDNITNEVVANDFKAVAPGDTDSAANGAILADPASTGDALRFISDNGNIKDAKTRVLAIQKLSNPLTTADQVVFNSNNGVRADVSSRIAQVAAAAGDDATKYGVWVSPTYSQATQKLRKGISGYKVTTSGATVGADTMLNDDVTVGIAGTMLKSNVKHKNVNSGDKTKVDSAMFSVYASQDMGAWFAQGQVSFGSSKVKTKQARITSKGTEYATGKYDGMTYNAEALVGYTYKIQDTATVTPIFGLSYAKFNDGGYKETGTTSQNLSISRKAMQKAEAVFGGRLATVTEMNGLTITPEAHAFLRHDVIGQKARTDIRLDGAVKALTPKANKPVRTTYNMGLGVNVQSGMMEYGAGYDATMGNKYVGHQGTLKVRVNL